MKFLNIVRVVLLWFLFTWWMLPMIWTLVFFIGFVLIGPEDTVEMCKDISKTFITGEIE